MPYARPLFADRRDAGRQLADRLATMRLRAPVVLALPRGGVPVAAEIAARLRAPLGVLLVRKLGAPYSPEFAIGAVAQARRRHRIVAPDVLARTDARWLDEQTEQQYREIERRTAMYAGADGKLAPDVTGRTAILVDDGIATGYTMRAGLSALAEEAPAHLLFAAPVGAADTVQSLLEQADGVCLHAMEDFRAVSIYYADFNQTTDEEVMLLLAQARASLAQSSMESTMQKISDVMSHDVAVVRPDDNLQRAAQLMSECDVGSLPVCDGRRLLGMITDRDITIRATAEGRAPEQVHVAEVMSEGVSYCFEDQNVGEVLQQMGDEQIRRLPVLDRNMQLVGVVAIGDLATRTDTHIDDAMQGISMPNDAGRAPTGQQDIGRQS